MRSSLLAGNLLDKGSRWGKPLQQGSSYDTRVRVGNEIDVLAEETHNPSGADPNPKVWIQQLCANNKAIVARGLCELAEDLDKARRQGLFGQAPFDVVESARQAFGVLPSNTGITYVADLPLVKVIAKSILDVHANEAARHEKNFLS
ncbi:MAG: hypothetical protein AAF384_06345 [Pseudomonadota bacterium]